MKKLWKQIVSIMLTGALLMSSAPLIGATNTEIRMESATIGTGTVHAVVVKDDGSLWIWGSNGDGMLGDGTTIDRRTPVKIMENVVSVSAEQWNTAAIKTDGSLWVWGGNTIYPDTPTKVMDDVADVSINHSRTVAIKTDGSLWAWDNDSVVSVNTYKPVKVMDGVKAASKGGNHTVAIKEDGGLWVLGDNPIKVMDDVVSVSAGYDHIAAIKEDGSLWTWGENFDGQLGDGTTISRSSPVKVMNDVVEVSAGRRHTAAIKIDGSLWTWGNNNGGLGDGTFEKRAIPMKVMDNVASVSAGNSYTLIVKEDGSLWACGANTFGQVGDGTTEIRLTPVKIMDGVRLDTAGVTSQPSTPTVPETPPHIYDEVDFAENLDFSNIISDVTDQQTAEKAIENGVSEMTPEQKSSPAGVDKATLLVEEAAARVNVKSLSGGSLNLKKDDLSSDAHTAVTAAEKVLNKNGIQTQRVPRAIQTYDAGDSKKISVQNEILSGDVDQIRVKASFASATASAKQANNFTMEDRGNKTVEVKFNTNTDNMVTVSFPGISADDKYMAVVDENGNSVGGKYNPVTGTLEAKLTASGIYRVVNNEKDFADVKSKSKEMQDAIKLLASKGVINGTSETTFAPDSTISRAEIAALLMRTLSLLDPNANGGFIDVTSANWFYGAAGSAKKHNIISGFEDNTFRGLNVIAKNQIVAVAARTLRQQMNYKTPSDITKELSVYGDNTSVENWAREDVALATMCNLVMKRTDGNFGGTANMTRGDAAIIIKRLFDKLW